MKKHSNPRDRVTFGLETIPEERTVVVSLRDLLFVHQALAEFVQFFHQPKHYPRLEDVERFLGTADSGGASDVLSEALYRRMRAMIPPDIEEAFDEGHRFEHPLTPAYFKASTPTNDER